MSKERHYPSLRSQHHTRLLKKYGAYCQGCGRNFRSNPKALQVDHIRPRSDDGTDAFENLTLLCRQCNQTKSDQMTITGLQLHNRIRRILLPENETNLKLGLRAYKKWRKAFAANARAVFEYVKAVKAAWDQCAGAMDAAWDQCAGAMDAARDRYEEEEWYRDTGDMDGEWTEYEWDGYEEEEWEEGTDEAWDRYTEATDEAWDQYSATMDKARSSKWFKYSETLSSVWDQYAEVTDEAWAKLKSAGSAARAALDAAREQYMAALSKARDEYEEEEVQDAWDEYKAATDKARDQYEKAKYKAKVAVDDEYKAALSTAQVELDEALIVTRAKKQKPPAFIR